MRLSRWKIALGVGIAAILTAATPTLAKWSDKIVLPNMADYNIFGLTSDMVQRTNGMLADTEKLATEVNKANATLDGLKRQDQLLAHQVNTNQSIQHELDQQLSGNVRARELMNAILTRERQTALLTTQVAVSGNQLTDQMIQVVSHLGKVADNTGQVARTSGDLNSRMDILLAELDRSIHNFRYIALVPQAIDFLKKQLGIDLPKPRNDGPPPSKPLVDPKPVEDVIKRVIPKHPSDSDDPPDSPGNELKDLLPIPLLP
ncbi:hypothetical protein JQC72_16295 [Polycladomyces sp. WAk]|uniref:Uncharacterized protein n=1 Tax=Polycladomyces zharkentensis TaxID=2807616 RepID=A0ABS2WNZ8_9BACL|nr:hypothetical protein [Polycladomyces sp. WAk]MBN2911054.1 hypothetical protein [Polycladomyces sp. WAk]